MAVPWKFAWALFPCLFALCGCSKNDSPKHSITLHVGNGTEPQTLDPHLMVDMQQINIGRSLFEGLVLIDDISLEPIPGVAESWEVSADGLVYTFHLRRDCLWSDGSPLGAGDFVYSIRRALSPELAAPMVELLFLLANGREFYEGNATLESVAVAAPDKYTVVLRLDRPVPYFLSLLAHPIWFPLQRKCIEAGGTAPRNSTWTRPGKMVSNGPYVLSSWRVGDKVLVKKNPLYRAAIDGAPEAIAFYPIGDSATEQNAFENGEIDITVTVPPDRMAAGDGTVHEVESLGVFYYVLRCDRPPLDDPHLRRALAFAIDREQICRLIGRDPRFASGTLVPPGCGGHVCSGKPFNHNPQKARKELSRSAGGGAGQLSIAVTDAAHAKLVAQVVQEMWRQKLSVAVGLCGEEWKSFLLTRRSGNFTIARGGWIGDYNDPTTFLNLFRSGSANNFCRWSNGAYDLEMAAADGELDQAKRRSHLQSAEAILLKEAPIIPLYFETNRHRVSRRVSGWHGNILDYHLWQNVRLSGK